VDNINIHPLSHRLEVIVQYQSIFAFESGVPLTHSLSVISENIIITHILPKTRLFDLYISDADSMGLTATTVTIENSGLVKYLLSK